MLDGSPKVLTVVAMGTNFWTQFVITGSVAFDMGNNFGCMIASDRLFGSRGWAFGVKLSEENILEIECLMVVVMATNCGTKIAITRFVRTTATRQLVMEGV